MDLKILSPSVAKICLLVSIIIVTTFVCAEEITYQQFTNALEKANKFIAENKFRELPSILPEFEENNLLLYINDPKTGINHGWNYYYIQQIIFNNRDKFYESAEYGDNAIEFLEISKLPTKATNEADHTIEEIKQFEYNKEKAKLLSYIQLGKASYNYGKNLFAERHLLYVLNSSNNANLEILCSAVSELAGFYILQGKYQFAYNSITGVMNRVKYLPKDIMYQKANASFWLGKNKEAFADLLSIIYSDDIDKEQPWSDPALLLFLKRIARAESSDILAFYDALSYQMENTSLENKYQDALVFYMSERNLLKKIYAYLENKDDVIKLRERYAKEYEKNKELQKNYNKITNVITNK